MAALFLSYRREDAAAHAGRLYDRLCERFGEGAVFMDVDSLQPGQDFEREIERRLAGCAALLAVIGPRWAGGAPGQSGRLREARDFVRRELAAALGRGITVIPVLVAGAGLPEPQALPEDLRALVRMQAVELRDRHFHRDVDDLLARLAPLAHGPGTAASGFAGEWAAEVRYGWGVTVTEHFVLSVEGGELLGTASFLRVPRGIQDGRVEGDRIRFVTVWEEIADERPRRVTNRYRGRLAGGAIAFRLQDDRGYPAVEFEALRAAGA